MPLTYVVFDILHVRIIWQYHWNYMQCHSSCNWSFISSLTLMQFLIASGWN